MGLFGGGNSSSSTVNQDNRKIYDLGHASFDNSVNGNLNNNTGTINVTDGHAFDVINSANNAMSGLASESLSLASSLGNNAMQYGYELGTNGINAGVKVAGDTQQFALSAIDKNAGIVNKVGDLSALMLDRTLTSNDNAISKASNIVDNSNQRTLDAALNFNQSTLYSQQLNADFAKALVAQNGDAAIQQQHESNTALNNGFKSMMQFADSFSRSDGASIAANNNKMIMVLVGGLAITAFIFKKVK